MMREAIRDLIARHAASEGITVTPLEGVQLFRLSNPIERLPAVYSPSICTIVQGEKTTYLGGQTHVYDARQYLCTTMSLPVESEVPHATPQEPLLGILISLETRAMAEITVEYRTLAHPRQDQQVSEPTPGLIVAEWDTAFAKAIRELLELLDDPIGLRVLGHGRLRELLYSVFQGDAGPLILRTLGGTQRIARALTYLRENLEEHVSVEDLARQAGMSRASFHRRFRETTTFSPLQFIKALRLNNAAMLLTQGVPVSRAASSVGYSSPSQFSREFRRQFGKAPKAWSMGASDITADVQAARV